MILQVGVKAFLVNQEGKILFLLRSSKYGWEAGKWDLPGGRIEPGSTLMENLKRELKEETELELTSEPVLVAAQDILKYKDKHIVRLTYTAHTEGEPKLDGLEHTEYRWVSPEDMAKMEDLDDYVKTLLDLKRVVI